MVLIKVVNCNSLSKVVNCNCSIQKLSFAIVAKAIKSFDAILQFFSVDVFTIKFSKQTLLLKQLCRLQQKKTT